MLAIHLRYCARILAGRNRIVSMRQPRVALRHLRSEAGQSAGLFNFFAIGVCVMIQGVNAGHARYMLSFELLVYYLSRLVRCVDGVDAVAAWHVFRRGFGAENYTRAQGNKDARHGSRYF